MVPSGEDYCFVFRVFQETPGVPQGTKQTEFYKCELYSRVANIGNINTTETAIQINQLRLLATFDV